MKALARVSAEHAVWPEPSMLTSTMYGMDVDAGSDLNFDLKPYRSAGKKV